MMMAIACIMSGCVSTTVVDVTSKPAIKATDNLPEAQLIDIGITLFEEGVPEDEAIARKKFINAEVRHAEAAFIPFQLRRTLESTENWGAVRLLPVETEAVDLLVSGEILHSDGEALVVKVHAKDASGKIWLKKKYSDVASRGSYDEDITGDEEAFQDLYNNIANDLLEFRQSLTADQLLRLRTVAKLKFAAEISPYAYADYYEVDDGKVNILRLPANEDPMLTRIEKIRDREFAMIDLLDEHYEGFHEEMLKPYGDWRRYSYEETMALRKMKRSARTTMLVGALATMGGVVASKNARSRRDDPSKPMDERVDDYNSRRAQAAAANIAVYAGIQMFRGGLALNRESKIHVEALKELGESFAAEVQPMQVEVEGRTVELTGTAEQQFDKWRELLREVYESETGLEVEDEELPQPDNLSTAN